MRWLEAVAAMLAGIMVMNLSWFLKARLNAILNRARFPGTDAQVNRVELSRKSSGKIATYQLRVSCSHAGKVIRLDFRIDAAEEEAARRHERYLALMQIFRVGQTVKLRHKPAMKFLGYFVDEPVYPQADADQVAKVQPHFRQLLVIGAVSFAVGSLLLWRAL